MYRALTQCVLVPAKAGRLRAPLNPLESQTLQWLREAGLRLTMAELVCLRERDIRPEPGLLGEENRQALTETIYTQGDYLRQRAGGADGARSLPGGNGACRAGTAEEKRGSSCCEVCMKKLKKLPPALRKQALLRFAGAGACFCLLLVVAVGYYQPMLWFPLSGDGCFFRLERRPADVEGGPRKGPGRGRRLQRSGINPVSPPAQGCGDGMRRPTGQGLSPCPRAESGCGGAASNLCGGVGSCL